MNDVECESDEPNEVFINSPTSSSKTVDSPLLYTFSSRTSSTSTLDQQFYGSTSSDSLSSFMGSYVDIVDPYPLNLNLKCNDKKYIIALRHALLNLL